MSSEMLVVILGFGVVAPLITYIVWLLDERELLRSRLRRQAVQNLDLLKRLDQKNSVLESIRTRALHAEKSL
jgi:hypothetical protein